MSMTFGMELELGDVDRSLQLPDWFGTWESAERDIINLRQPYAYRAADPLGVDPPVGGEINVVPAHSPAELVDTVMRGLDWLRGQGQEPTVCCTTHTHVHVRVKGLRDQPILLKKLMSYVMQEQESFIRAAYPFEDHPDMDQVKKARTYLKWDGGRRTPEWMIENILNHQHLNFAEFIRLHCCGKDGVSRGRPFRYAINTYCLKHIDTVEFRCFRSTLSRTELYSCIAAAERFMIQALTSGAPWGWTMFEFPPFVFDLNTCIGYETTRHPDTRGEKRRVLHDI